MAEFASPSASASLIEPGKLRSDAPEAPTAALPDTTKIELLLDAAASKAIHIDPRLAGCLAASKPILVVLLKALLCVWPFYVWMWMSVVHIYHTLPTNILQALFGIALCFFGGTYVASIAAIEAFRQMGWQKVYTELEVVYVQLGKVYAAWVQEAAADPGVSPSDAKARVADEQLKRLAFSALRSVNEPARLQVAVGALWTSYVAVLATLRLEFARTTAFALGIVELIKYPLVRTCSPPLLVALSAEIDVQSAKAWSVTLVESVLTLAAVVLAWYLQMVISAFYSGLRGGRLFAEAACNVLIERGWMQKLPCVTQPFKREESYLDEILGYSLAAAGFSFQILSGFQLPFPLNIIFAPLTLLEWFLKIQISMTDSLAH